MCADACADTPCSAVLTLTPHPSSALLLTPSPSCQPAWGRGTRRSQSWKKVTAYEIKNRGGYMSWRPEARQLDRNFSLTSWLCSNIDLSLSSFLFFIIWGRRGESAVLLYKECTMYKEVKKPDRLKRRRFMTLEKIRIRRGLNPTAPLLALVLVYGARI